MKIKTRWFRIFHEPNWRYRPYPYWFNAKYPGGMRRICIPFLTIDIFGKK